MDENLSTKNKKAIDKRQTEERIKVLDEKIKNSFKKGKSQDYIKKLKKLEKREIDMANH